MLLHVSVPLHNLQGASLTEFLEIFKYHFFHENLSCGSPFVPCYGRTDKMKIYEVYFSSFVIASEKE